MRNSINLIIKTAKAERNNTMFTRFINWAKQYNKLWIALLGAVLTTLSAQFPTNEAVVLVITFATALGVYVTPNKTK